MPLLPLPPPCELERYIEGIYPCWLHHKSEHLFKIIKKVMMHFCSRNIWFILVYRLTDFLCFKLGINHSACFYSCFQTKLHFSRWNGVGKDYPVHYVSLWDIFERNPWSFLGYCTVVHNSQLGKGVPHLDRVECGCVSWESSESADHSVVWNVFQRSTGKSSSWLFSFFFCICFTVVY